MKCPALHATIKALKGLVGDLVGSVGKVLTLVGLVVACGALCGTLAVEIDQVQQDGCDLVSLSLSTWMHMSPWGEDTFDGKIN